MQARVFICYARSDQAFALGLADTLKKRGVTVWVDQWDIPSAADWDEAIDAALHNCSHLLIVLSRASVESSEVKGELRQALDLNKPIVPVCYEKCKMPRRLLLLQWIDFRRKRFDDPSGLAQVLSALGVAVPDGHSPAPPPERKTEPLPSTWRASGPSKARFRALIALGLFIGLSTGLWYGLKELTHDARAMHSAALSPDGSLLATTHGQGFRAKRTVHIWNVDSGKRVRVVGADGSWAAEWSPDGQRLAVGAGNWTIQIFDAQRWQALHVLSNAFSVIGHIRWSPDGQALAYNDDASVWVWSTSTGKPIFHPTHHSGRIHALAWSPDSSRLATASSDGTVAILDAHDGHLLAKVTGHTSGVTTVAWSPNGQSIASGSYEEPHLLVSDPKDGKAIHKPMGLHSLVEATAWSNDGRYLASLSRDSTVRIWDGRTFSSVRQFKGGDFSLQANSLAWSPDSTLIAAGDNHNVVWIWNVETDALVAKLGASRFWDYAVISGWSKDGNRIGAMSSFQDEANVWNAKTGERLKSFRVGIFEALTGWRF